jgi:hypothetical protein
MSNKVKYKLNELPIEKKIELINKHLSGEKVNKLAIDYTISEGTLFNIFKNWEI